MWWGYFSMSLLFSSRTTPPCDRSTTDQSRTRTRAEEQAGRVFVTFQCTCAHDRTGPLCSCCSFTFHSIPAAVEPIHTGWMLYVISKRTEARRQSRQNQPNPSRAMHRTKARTYLAAWPSRESNQEENAENNADRQLGSSQTKTQINAHTVE